MKRMAALVFVGAALVGAEDAAGQWQEQVRNQIEAAGNYLSERGFSHQGDHDGSLDDGESEDFWVDLDGGVEYAMIGVCDTDCDDIDLEIFDSNGNSLDSDYELDDAPVVEFTPARSGRYRVHVYLANCETAPCFYGVGTFARDADDSTNEYEAQVERYMQNAAGSLEDDGYIRTHETRIGSLAQGASDEFWVRLRGGTAYQIRGVCDNDCDDIDLAIYDDDGAEIDSDYLEDDVPYLGVNPGSTGQYRIEVSMPGCKTEPCYWGVGVWGRGGGKGGPARP